MKKLILVVFIIVGVRIDSAGQTPSKDSVFKTYHDYILQYCLKEVLKNSDTTMIFFEGSEYKWDTSFYSGGPWLVLKPANRSDSFSIRNLPPNYFFEKERSFDFMINLIIDRNTDLKTKLARLPCNVLYIYNAFQSWQQFLLDSLLGYDTLIMPLQIDYLVYEDNNLRHERYYLKCSYTELEGFKITDQLRRSKVFKITN